MERSYPVVHCDALRAKIRDKGSVRNKVVHLALGIATDGTRDVLGETAGGMKWCRRSEHRSLGRLGAACTEAARGAR